MLLLLSIGETGYGQVELRYEQNEILSAKEEAWKEKMASREFKIRKETDVSFAENPYQQLRFIYERSPWSEATYKRYPVYRKNY